MVMFCTQIIYKYHCKITLTTNRMAKQEIYDYLREIHCCMVCCLRYFNGRSDDYVDVEKSFQLVNIKRRLAAKKDR